MWALTSRPKATELFSNMIIFQWFSSKMSVAPCFPVRENTGTNTLWHLRPSVFHSRHPLSALRVWKVQVSAWFYNASFPSAVSSHSWRKPLTWLFIPTNKDTDPCLLCQSSCKSFSFFFFKFWRGSLMTVVLNGQARTPGGRWGGTVRIWGGGDVGDQSGRGRARLVAS